MHAAPHTWRRIADWYRPGTPKGVVGIQLGLNSFMLTALITLQRTPWLTFAALALCLIATLALHAPRRRWLIALFGLTGWTAEAWLVGVGGVWVFAHPATHLVEGGLFGVPFYMLPAWSLIGALMLALADLTDGRR